MLYANSCTAIPRLSLSLPRLSLRSVGCICYFCSGRGALKGGGWDSDGNKWIASSTRDELEQQDLLTSILKKWRILNRRGEKGGIEAMSWDVFFFLWKIFRKKELECFKGRKKKRRCGFEKLDQGREGRLWNSLKERRAKKIKIK